MKPSEKIGQHFQRILKEHPKAKELIYEDPHHQWKVEIAAIKDYLDEVWEKEQNEILDCGDVHPEMDVYHPAGHKRSELSAKGE